MSNFEMQTFQINHGEKDTVKKTAIRRVDEADNKKWLLMLLYVNKKTIII